MYKKIVWMMLVILLGYATFFPMSSEAQTTNAKDCREKDINCPELDSSEPESESGSETSKIMGENGKDTESAVSSSSLFLDLVKLFFALILVLALIYFLLKFLNRKNKMFQKVRTLENLGGISLGQNKSLQVVRIGQRMYVIGVGENVEMLSEITDEQTKTQILSEDEEKDFNPSNLMSLLSSKTKENKKGESSSSKGFQEMFQSELNRLKQGRKKMIDQHQDKEEDRHE